MQGATKRSKLVREIIQELPAMEEDEAREIQAEIENSLRRIPGFIEYFQLMAIQAVAQKLFEYNRTAPPLHEIQIPGIISQPTFYEDHINALRCRLIEHNVNLDTYTSDFAEYLRATQVIHRKYFNTPQQGERGIKDTPECPQNGTQVIAVQEWKKESIDYPQSLDEARTKKAKIETKLMGFPNLVTFFQAHGSCESFPAGAGWWLSGSVPGLQNPGYFSIESRT